ncbi:hypothetical protein GQ42DRAFT_146407 [Ramicandelaber brevisporus]|nr:hypothetical protein GQ42DRAFT_146407 [Ramicandelaber brevisporus]
MQHILEDTSALALLFSGQPEMYTKPSQLVPHGTVGKHVRHIIEHFELLADAAEALVSHSHRGNDGKLLASDKVILCYNKRNRGSLVESSIPEAVRASDAVQGRLFDLIDNPHITSQLQLLVSDPVMVSTFGRELWFCIHHAVHHHATLKVLCMEHDIALSDQFGVAPSTTAHYIEACSSTSSSSTSNQPTAK